MNRVNFLALAIITVMAFFASSIWYSTLLFGPEFLELSGATAGPQPNALKGGVSFFVPSSLPTRLPVWFFVSTSQTGKARQDWAFGCGLAFLSSC